MRKILTSVTILLFVLVLSACGGENVDNHNENNNGNENAATSSGDHEITIAIDQNFVTLDPHDAGDTVSIFGTMSMYEGLVGFDENMEIVPVLAEDYEISDDGLTYTFKLREDVKFHDGAEFNAEAVEANYERIMSDDENLSAKRNFQFIDSFEIIDDYEVEFTLDTPFSPMINKFAMVPMVSPDAIEEGTSFVEMNPVGTGQFKFVEWRQGTTLELERFDDYWSDEQSNVEKVFFEPVPENGSRVAMLKTGEADFIYPVPQQNVEELKGDDSIVVNETPSTIARYVSINTSKEPLNDERVRKAMNYAVDKDAYIQVVKDGYGNLLDSTMSTEVQHYAEQETYDFDLDKANELMAEAGYESGFEVEIWGNTTSETVKGMEFIKQQLEQINIDVKIQSMEEGTLSDEIYTPETPEESKVQLWYVSWSPSSGDADGATRSLFSNEYFPPNGSNSAYYDNDDVTKWINDANEAIDVEEQKELYEKIQETVYEDAPWIFLATDVNLSAQQDHLEGVYVLPDGSVVISDAQVK